MFSFCFFPSDHLESDAVMCYLQQSVHIRLHVRDGHPLHDDVIDTPLQRLPFGPGCPAEVDTSHPHWGAPEERETRLA